MPHEFTLPAAEAEWVARWQADRKGDTVFGLASQAAGALAAWFADRWGVLAAVLLVALLLRLGMLPFSLL